MTQNKSGKHGWFVKLGVRIPDIAVALAIFLALVIGIMMPSKPSGSATVAAQLPANDPQLVQDAPNAPPQVQLREQQPVRAILDWEVRAGDPPEEELRRILDSIKDLERVD